MRQLLTTSGTVALIIAGPIVLAILLGSLFGASDETDGPGWDGHRVVEKSWVDRTRSTASVSVTYVTKDGEEHRLHGRVSTLASVADPGVECYQLSTVGEDINRHYCGRWLLDLIGQRQDGTWQE